MQIICHGLKEEDFQAEFTDHKIFLGRDVSNSIPVSAEGISRYHAILIEEDDALFLQDNDSMNGTFLNNDQIRNRQQLANGDIIQIGYRLIKVEFHPDQKVILDFVPPEQTEIVSRDSAWPPLKIASPEPERTMVAGDDIERTMVAGDDIERTMVVSETMLSRSSMPDRNLLPGGSEIGKYVIIKRLGKGGMGEVYLAKHMTLGICRALKILSKNSGDNDTRSLDRFLREAKLASEIRHPNVVGVMDVETGEDCGFPYIVMEYVDGGSLRNSLTASVRLSEEQAVVIVEAIASALQAAEEHNIVHRDIKPDNIMFTRRGEVKLADLGIAKVDGKDADLTRTNMMIGTPAYLPPEQAQNAKDVDARADIYSLGATFYEMLTGQQPYPGENSIEVLHKLFLAPVPDPRKINPAVSPASAMIVMKMMAKDPKDRFQNATELLTMMERTFPPHTTQESAELIRKVIAGEVQGNATFSSNISLSRFSILWSRIPNKKFVLPVSGLVLAICVLCILFPFLGKKPAKSSIRKTVPERVDIITENDSESVPVETETGTFSVKSDDDIIIPVNDPPVRTPAAKSAYRLMINTTLGATISYISPDRKHQWEIKVDEGYIGTTVRTPGKYSIMISKEGYSSITRDIEVYDDVTIDLPLSRDPLVVNNHSSTWTETEPAPHLPLPGDPLVVTTDKDVLDANDGVVSLREAFTYIRSHAERDNTIRFSDDLEIRLSSAITVTTNTLIDGGKHHVTIIGPENDLMFRRGSGGALRLKNLSLMSDYSGGILDSDFSVKLTSVKDGGKAEYLWRDVPQMTLEQGTHLHRVSIRHSFASIVIQPGSILEDFAGTGNGRLEVLGVLKNASIRDGKIFVNNGGVCDNLSLRDCVIEHYDGGTITNLNIGPGTLYGYEPNAVLKGTVSVGGVVLEPIGRSDDHSIVGKETDVVFDMTERATDTYVEVKPSSDTGTKYDYFASFYYFLVQNLKAFSGARSYTVKVRKDQTAGPYKLAGHAEGFRSRVSLVIGNDVYSNALSLGENVSVGNKVYSLSLDDDMRLILSIRLKEPGEKVKSVGVKPLESQKDDGKYLVSLPDKQKTDEKGKTSADTNGAPNEQEKLHGALYLLTGNTGGRSNSLLSSAGKKDAGADRDRVYSVLQKFVLGSWMPSTNSKGDLFYSELDRSFSRRKTAPPVSYFYQNTVPWENGTELFDCRDFFGDAADKDAEDAGNKDVGWIAVYSGYVVAPFSGKIRFLGYCDDMMTLRFNRQVVLDYGNRSLTARLPLPPDHGMALHAIDSGERVDHGSNDLSSLLGGNPATREEKRMLNESPLYSKNKLEVNERNLAISSVLSVQKGQVIPIDILLGESCEADFSVFLLVERLAPNGKPFASPGNSTFLFRTTQEMPDLPEDNSIPFNPDSPVWKVVDNRGNPIPAKRTQK